MGRVIWNIIYTLFTAVWGATVNWRVIHTRARKYLFSAAGLMIFWLTIRIIKWQFVRDPAMTRQLWYLYYVPMLMIPLLCLYTSVILGRTEDSPTPFLLKAAFGLTVFFILFVLTNDMHQKVFSFPGNRSGWTDKEYRYEIGYFLVSAWEMFCGLSAFLVMIRKARKLRNRKILFVPILSLGVLLLYCILYVMHLIHMVYPLNDLTMIFCLCVTITLEGCIQSGLIPSNTHYADLFGLSMIDGQIIDRDYFVRLTSGYTEPLPDELVRETVEASKESGEGILVPGERTRLLSAPIKYGYVLWKEDISEISELIEELADMGEYLTARETALKEEVETSRKEHLLAEKNRLYNTLMNKMSGTIHDFSDIVDQISQTENPAEIKKLTKRLAITCTYIKRQGNFFFLAEQDGYIRPDELCYALEEYFANLRLDSVICGSASDLKEPIAFSDTLFLYDAFQKILLQALDTLQSIFVNYKEEEGKPIMLVSLTCKADFSETAYPGITILEADEEEWMLQIMPQKGGGVG